LPIAKITDNGYIVTFTKHHATVNRPDGSLALTATKYNDLYNVHNKEERAILTNGKRDTDLIKWHQRYGYLNVSDLKSMKNNDIAQHEICVTDKGNKLRNLCKMLNSRTDI